MRKLSQRAAFIFIRLAFLCSEAARAAVPDGHAGTGHAFPSAARYYFSRRIFPQMNFMKTVFALLINRSSVGEPTARHSSSRGESAREATGTRARLLVIILFQRLCARTAEKRAAALVPFPRLRRAIRDLRDLRKLAATLHTDVPFFFRRQRKERLEKWLAQR